MGLSTLELAGREQSDTLLKHAESHSGAIKVRGKSMDHESEPLNGSSQHKTEREHEEDEEDSEPLEMSSTTKKYGYATAIAMVLITLYSIPTASSGKSVQYVWWCGWMTAVATGLGALPFYWIQDVNKYWLGICNGLAAGMMLAATGCLFYEAWFIPQHVEYAVSVGYRLFVGAFLGVLFIKFTKLYLEDYEDVKVCGLKGMDARKALLIMAVMTLHSVSEGIGVGVSFGGEGGVRRGHIVTLTMAIHNIPEGVAISLALVPRGLSVFFATLWCILSSIPQPIFAVPSFMFVEQSLPILPAGLGFAGGAMAYVAINELLPESLEDTKSLPSTISATSLAFMVFLTIQLVLSGNL
ncbi:hypothetical protein Poli38472_007624 [Pythium oligandrum]|uniref:Uncharacterized protein n=1 Tax=Pythium oligandrum TaxID=41045 RepID=A0A8K1FQH5_PYTOL|nr:hypothetical protein Poli38472_007624 [Pythium oligandrum]|eukprot:TMW67952.1 hypothetical protein Poli38472_007624 [Pythium oligandrum]